MTDLLSAYLPYQNELFSGVLADVLDGLGHRRCALPHDIRPLNSTWKLFGRVATLLAEAVDRDPEHPYAVEMDCLDNLKPGDVLVATTSGERTCALWGELLSTACRARQARGVILDGLTRDAARILAMDFPVFAAGFSPLDSRGRLDGIRHGVPLQICPCTVHPGDLIFGDIDGVVIIPAHLAAEALPRALEKVRGENRVREELAKGRKLSEVFSEYGIL